MEEKVRIITNRFYIRDLEEKDVSYDYLSWLRDSNVGRWIETAQELQTLQDLRVYVRNKYYSTNCEFFGIFERLTNRHIGNIKYEPISLTFNGAVMGVLLGNPEYRGKGVFGEIFEPSSQIIRTKYGIRRIYLGVDNKNKSALRAYEKCGFCPANLTSEEKNRFGAVSLIRQI
jgi:Acetyltransferases, including N-acetylases of ribosomal proteins